MQVRKTANEDPILITTAQNKTATTLKRRRLTTQEREVELAIKKRLVNFYVVKDVACYIFLFLMVGLLLEGHVNGRTFLVSQVMNAVIRGIGKGLYRITSSLFPEE